MTEEENCKDGNPHDWEITEDDKWTDTSVENGNVVITARYHARTRTCINCGKFEVISGNVVTRSGSEYMLEKGKNGTWGMGIT